MPENDNTADAGEQVQQEQAGFSAPSSQEELDRIIQKRIERERSKFADYDDLKAKAAEFEKFEESQKSELEKAQERAERAERALAEASATAVRAEVAAEKGVPVALLSGDSREALIASAEALLAFRDETARKGNYVPSEGRNSNIDKGGDTRAFVNTLWESAQNS